MKQPAVYILTNKPNGTLYIGVTADLAKRIWIHRYGGEASFVTKYGLRRLVYVEQYANMATAIVREKRLKRWKRAWKIRLIEEQNPEWQELLPDTESSEKF